jgi:hypothetical protein
MYAHPWRCSGSDREALRLRARTHRRDVHAAGHVVPLAVPGVGQRQLLLQPNARVPDLQLAADQCVRRCLHETGQGPAEVPETRRQAGVQVSEMPRPSGNMEDDNHVFLHNELIRRLTRV